jgi:hypothetical protein
MTPGFKQEPYAPFRFVNPVFQQARRRHIVVLAAQRMLTGHKDARAAIGRAFFAANFI